MKERPILFSAQMVRAILDGRKTQTRRVVNHQPDSVNDGEPYWNIGGYRAWRNRGIVNPLRMGTHNPLICKYGQQGDRLWVRESYRIGAWNEEIGAFALDYCDGPVKNWLTPTATKTEDSGDVFERMWIDCCDELMRKGIEPDADGQYRWKPGESPLRWRPSIHMPRWASRITLEITGVRVERLQEISDDDAKSEGVDLFPYSMEKNSCPLPLETIAQWRFRELWESINGDGSWNENPWVWVIEFKAVQP